MRKALSSWDILAQPLFRSVWVASFASNIGTWIQNTGAAWVMTSLTTSPFSIALLQTAMSVPVFLLGLPAGALADIVDRRKLLIFAQLEMLVAAALLALLTFAHVVSPSILIFLTFLLGIGNALALPAWIAAVPETVERKDLGKSLALNSVSYNAALAVGPALAGIVLGVGAGWVFVLNAASFVGVIYALWRWKRKPTPSSLPSEELITAMKAGYRYLRYSPLLQNVVIRTGIFTACGSVFWGLFPSLARFSLHASSLSFGVLYGFMGFGTIVAATVLPQVQANISIDKRVVATSCMYAFGLLLLVFAPNVFVAYAAMAILGFSWLLTISSFNVYVQSIVAGWVKARAIGVYMLVLQGGLAFGALLWGSVASATGIAAAFCMAAIGLIASAGGAYIWPLYTDKKIDVAYSFHWPEPEVMPDIDHERGPVLITNKYEVATHDEERFLAAIGKLKGVRLRDGAISWGVFRDTERMDRFIENFIVESWAEHMRQHVRATLTDKALEEQVHQFTKDKKPPVTLHYIAEDYS